jgi:hypothetical protein
MHRLVQTVVRQSLSEQRRRAWAKTALDLVHSAFPSDKAPADKLVTNPANWPDCARLLPTLLTVTRFSEQLGVSSPRAADLMHRAAIYLHWNADLSAALDLLVVRWSSAKHAASAPTGDTRSRSSRLSPT